jgi:hypothetical protein
MNQKCAVLAKSLTKKKKKKKKQLKDFSCPNDMLGFMDNISEILP